MLHRATGPKTLSLSHQIAGRMRRTRNHAVSCWSTCCSRAPGFSFPPFNYILKIFKNGLLNRRFPPLYNWEPYHTSSFQIKSQSENRRYTCKNQVSKVTMNCRCFSMPKRCKGVGRVTVQWVRTHARTRLPGAAGRQPPGSAQGTIRSMGGGPHRRWL